jgi:hypothetical protein
VRRPTIYEASRALGVPKPGRIGDPLTTAALVAVWRGSPTGAHLWVTDVFHRVLNQVPPQGCFRFWKAEVKPRLMQDGIFCRDLWPGGYAYLAYRWVSPFPEPLIELMRCE